MDKEQRNQYNKKYYQNNKERLKEYQQKNRERRKEYYHNNKDKGKEYYQNSKKHRKEYRQTHKEHISEMRRKRHYREKYNLTLEEIDQMLIAQNHRCALCGKSLIETKRYIDHSHETDKVRGILCHKCNVGLGYLQYFYDDPELLKKATVYIKIK